MVVFFFFNFLFIFALTFHKCQIVERAFLSFFLPFFFKVCWAPRCSFFRRTFLCAFLFVFSSSFGLFLGSFLALGARRRAAPFSVGLCVCVFVCVTPQFPREPHQNSNSRKVEWALEEQVMEMATEKSHRNCHLPQDSGSGC